MKTWFSKKESSRQSQLSPTIQHSILSLFKRLSNKLGFLLDGYLISRNDHCQDGYPLSLEKPFKEMKYFVVKTKSIVIIEAQLTFSRDKREDLLNGLK